MTPKRPLPLLWLQGYFSSGMMERWNSTSQIQGTAGNREAGGLVNIAVTMKLLKDYPLWKFGVQIKSSA